MSQRKEIIVEKLRGLGDREDEFVLAEEVSEPRLEDQILIIHTDCKNIYKVKCRRILYDGGGKCPNCYNHGMKRVNHIERMKETLGSGYEFLDVKIVLNETEKVKLRHRCGNEFFLTSKQVVEGSKCPFCFNRSGRDISFEAMSRFVSEKYNGDFSYLSFEMRKNAMFLKLRHNKCGREFGYSDYFFKNKRPECPGCEKSLTTESFKKIIFDLVGDEYSVLGEYKYSNEPVLMRHNKCGREFSVRPNNFIHQGNRCKKCSPLAKTTEEYRRELEEKFEDRFILLSEYKNMDTKVKVLDQKTGFEKEVRPYNLLQYNPSKIQQSMGEYFVQRFLTKNNFKYEKQKTFPNLRDINLLSYDFYIPSLNLLIEFDGEQHFKPIFGCEKFEFTKRHDALKQQYAEINKINILRIKYTEIKKIDDILTEKILGKEEVSVFDRILLS